jgi:hypothetical protein
VKLFAPSRRRAKPEAAEQEKALRLLRSMGARVWVAGTTRKRGDYQGTMQTPGLPDLPFVFLRRGDGYTLLVVEMKSPTAARSKLAGRSPEQVEFAQLCELSDINYFCGDCDGLIGWLISHGFLRADQVAADHTHATLSRD